MEKNQSSKTMKSKTESSFEYKTKVKEKGFIDYFGVEKVIVDIEYVFANYGLDPNEKGFVINQITARINKAEQARQANELAGNMNLGSIMKMAKGALFKNEEKE